MLEAVIIVSVMVSSVAFVVTLDLPTPPSEQPRAALAQRASDILAVLNDTPVAGSSLGTTLLQVALQECMQGDCARLEGKMAALLPTDAQWGLYLSTAEGLHPVRAHREPPGEAVTARRAVEPAWSYQFLAASQSLHDPTRDPLLVFGLPVFSGSPVDQGGHALRITVEGRRLADNAEVRFRAAATTRASESDDPTPAAVSLFFHHGGSPVATRDVRAGSLSGPGVPSGSNVTLALRLVESGGGVVPAGTQVAVQVPHGWQAWAPAEANAARWKVETNATDKNGGASGSTIVARLLAPLSAGSADLVVDAKYLGDAPDHYRFRASLSHGAYTTAEALVRADAHALVPTFEVPAVVASVPRPLGVGAQTTWTLGAFSPEAVHVTRVVVEEEAGREIFAGVSGLAGGGAWSAEGDRLVWTGSVVLGQSSPLDLAFQVQSAGTARGAAERPPFVPSVDIGGFSGRLLDEAAPGLYRGVFPPSSATYRGYETSTGPALKAAHLASSDAVYRTTPLPGRLEYGVGYGVSLGDSVFGSAVSPARRVVSPGETATLEVEVQSVAYQLALLGFEPSIDLHVYPPWSYDERTPVLSRSLYTPTLGGAAFRALLDTSGDGIPDPSDAGRYQVDVDVPRTWLYGPYVVEVRLTWLEQLSGIVGGLPLAENVVRSASVYEYVLVAPTDGAIPPAPVYDVHLVTWFDDWG